MRALVLRVSITDAQGRTRIARRLISVRR